VELEAGWVGHRPSSLGLVEAAAVPLPGSTALQLLDRLALRRDESLLVHGASGGVGRMLVQLAAMRGIRIAGAARRERHALLRDLGVEAVLDREQGDVVGAAVSAFGGQFDAVADLAGHGLLSASLTGLREGGSAASIVELCGDLDEAVDRNIRLHGVLVRLDRGTLDRLAEAIEASLRSIVDAVVEPDAIVDAHRAIDAGEGPRKVVLSMTRSDHGTGARDGLTAGAGGA
jgi:NADPH:quinone reductase-like Zn-dependent oxidoreductase